MSQEVLILAALLTGWCVLHSAAISETVSQRMQQLLGDAYRYYRLGYNIVALVTFALVLWYYRTLDPAMLHVWPFPWVLLQAAFILAGIVFLYLGGKVYNQSHFIGIEQIRKGPDTGSGPPPALKTDGILGEVRHPYYTGGILLLVAIGDGTPAVSILQTILIAYLYIGTLLEERKLIHEFGDSYRRYMERVPRYFPKIFGRK